MWKGQTDGVPVDESVLIYGNSWKFEGETPEFSPRLIWFMNAIQDLSKEFKRRNRESNERKAIEELKK